MKIRSHIRSVQLIFTVLMLVIPAGLTGCMNKGDELTEQELALEEETVSADTEEAGEIPEELSKEDKPARTEEQPAQTAAAELPETIYVDVCGAVASPGVYELPGGSRVFQAIEKAGGYLPEAAMSYLNRARSLSDGQQIYVPTQEEVDSEGIPPAEDGGGEAGDSGTGQETAGGTDRINLNTADVSQLTTLTGVGQSKALAIIAYREENGPFTSVEDIMNVPGIKEGTYEKIKDKIAIE